MKKEIKWILRYIVEERDEEVKKDKEGSKVRWRLIRRNRERERKAEKEIIFSFRFCSMLPKNGVNGELAFLWFVRREMKRNEKIPLCLSHFVFHFTQKVL